MAATSRQSQKSSQRRQRAPRKPRVSQKDASAKRNAQHSRRLMKQRIIALESRLVVLERYIEHVSDPEVLAAADLARESVLAKGLEEMDQEEE